MLESIKKINKINSFKDIDEKDLWLKYLYTTREKNYNILNVKALSELNNKSVFNYVKKSLLILEEEKLDETANFYVEETLKWMDVAKCGLKNERKEWTDKGYDLFVHNIGSSQIYYESNKNEIIYTLIRTHGLIGQHIKGEVNFIKNMDLYNLIEKKLIAEELLQKVLYTLNKCIIGAISLDLWNNVEGKVSKLIERIIKNEFFYEEYYNNEYIIERFTKLRKQTTEEEKNIFNEILVKNEDFKNTIGFLFENLELWFLDSALNSFQFEEVIKILYIIGIKLKKEKKYFHLSFENVMKNMYLDYKGIKNVNIYKERIIESYLKNISYEQIKSDDIYNKDLNIRLSYLNKTVLINFEFSIAATKLIEFCEIAYGTDSIFNKAVFLLYDLFSFRRDEYDRFYNEIDYLKTMNESLSQKSKILDYITGKNILDIGPGGGALMDLILEKLKAVNVYGIDISSNVIEELNKKKLLENKKWNLIKGDALELPDYFEKGKIDTIIYSSIIHELYSYIPFEGKKFNHNTIKKALLAAYEILPAGGRIIIRDGIMTEDKELNRIIKFKDKEDIKILDRYCNDFEGRKVTYRKLKEAEVMMKVNDAMEFLYTYTWGENSYSLEVKEQFGYFTPAQYVNFIKEIFNNKCKIVECIHFLQDGYEEHLFEKIEFYDENYKSVSLPDSTCIIVIEKI